MKSSQDPLFYLSLTPVASFQAPQKRILILFVNQLGVTRLLFVGHPHIQGYLSSDIQLYLVKMSRNVGHLASRYLRANILRKYSETAVFLWSTSRCLEIG